MNIHASLQAVKGSVVRSFVSCPSAADHHECPKERVRWDTEVAALNGSLLQSWRWGAFKAEHGWTVERVRVNVGEHLGLAQVLIRRSGPFSLAYVPRGPVLPDDAAAAMALFGAIDETCRRHRAITLMVEPDRPLPLTGDSRSLGFVRGPRDFQPERTVKVPLLDDAALLAQMRRDTRANIRRAERAGVVIERADPSPASAARFYDLLSETADRNTLGIHAPEYYADLLHHFGDDALVSFARVCNQDAVTLVAVRHGHEAIYLYGGSAAAQRVRGAAALLLRWTRCAGRGRAAAAGTTCGASPPAADLAQGQVARTQGEQWDGLYQFKTGFGGEIVTYPPLLEWRYRLWIGFAARRILPRYRTAPMPRRTRVS